MGNREIKFRARRIDNERWVYGQYFKTPLTDENSGTTPDAGWFFLSGEPRHCIVQYPGVSFVIDPETLGEYTGLKDKNGKEIYEGDVLFCQGGNEHQGYREFSEAGMVEFAFGSFDFVYHSSVGKVHCSFGELDKADCEVIGNVWEDGELLNDRERTKADSVHQ